MRRFSLDRSLRILAEIGKVDEFFEAVDSDDFAQAKRLLKRAGVDAASIARTLEKMGAADGEH